VMYHSADSAKCATPTHHQQCFAIDAIYPAMYCTVLGRKLQLNKKPMQKKHAPILTGISYSQIHADQVST